MTISLGLEIRASNTTNSKESFANDTEVEPTMAGITLGRPPVSPPIETIPVNQKAQINPEPNSKANPSLEGDPKASEPASNQMVKKKRLNKNRKYAGTLDDLLEPWKYNTKQE